MAVITINGTRFEVPDGSSVSVNGGSISVGGSVLISGLKDTVHVNWSGPVGNLDCTSCTITGDVHGDVDATQVKVSGSVGGNVDGTQITCGDVKGRVSGTSVSHR